MTPTLIETLTSTPEGMALFQQERTILEVTELICRLMREQNVTKSVLADRLGRSKAFVTQLLDGRANMTLRTLSDVLGALGKSLHFSAADLAAGSAPRVVNKPAVIAFESRGDGQVHFHDVTFEYTPPPRGKKTGPLRMTA